MDTEETHTPAPRDEWLFETARTMAVYYFRTLAEAKKLKQDIQSDEMDDAVYVAFAEAINESGYTEDAGYDSPRTVWFRLKEGVGL